MPRSLYAIYIARYSAYERLARLQYASTVCLEAVFHVEHVFEVRFVARSLQPLQKQEFEPSRGNNSN